MKSRKSQELDWWDCGELSESTNGADLMKSIRALVDENVGLAVAEYFTEVTVSFDPRAQLGTIVVEMPNTPLDETGETPCASFDLADTLLLDLFHGADDSQRILWATYLRELASKVEAAQKPSSDGRKGRL